MHLFARTDPPGGVLLGILGRGVPPASPNPDPISDQKMPFPIPVFRPGLKNPYPFSDLTLYVIMNSIFIRKSIPDFRPKRLKSHTLWGGTYLYT